MAALYSTRGRHPRCPVQLIRVRQARFRCSLFASQSLAEHSKPFGQPSYESRLIVMLIPALQTLQRGHPADHTRLPNLSLHSKSFSHSSKSRCTFSLRRRYLDPSPRRFYPIQRSALLKASVTIESVIALPKQGSSALLSCRKRVSCHAPILRFPRGHTETQESLASSPLTVAYRLTALVGFLVRCANAAIGAACGRHALAQNAILTKTRCRGRQNSICVG